MVSAIPLIIKSIKAYETLADPVRHSLLMACKGLLIARHNQALPAIAIRAMTYLVVALIAMVFIVMAECLPVFRAYLKHAPADRYLLYAPHTKQAHHAA